MKNLDRRASYTSGARPLPCLLPLLLALGALASALPAAAAILPADRLTTWRPGVTGGIPVRTTVCATIQASTYGNGTLEASGGINAAITACPVGQVVQLSAGTFRINTSHIAINKGITLRGVGSNSTELRKSNGASPGSETVGDARPVVVIGPNRYPHIEESTARNLTADAVKGTFSVTVTSGAGFVPGQFALLDEDNYLTGGWISLPPRNDGPPTVLPQIWATDRVVWQKHNPTADEDDPFPGALTWFSRSGRPVNELKEIASVSGNTVTFTTPIHITYRTSHTAQLTRWIAPNLHVRNAGLEDLRVYGGGDGAIRFESAAYSWVKGVENSVWRGEGVAVNKSFRCELRDSYIHDAARSVPGGGAYAVSLGDGSAEILVENNIIMRANKMMVARCTGAGSVVGYNYADDGFIAYSLTWQEVGINGSHMVGPHHMLFEGNESFNYDSDNTHGTSIYQTVFRNHLIGFRRTYDTPGGSIGNGRAAGLGYGSWWHSFFGNVLGVAGQMTGWMYDDPGNKPGGDPWGDGAGKESIWRLGYDPIHWEQKVDTKVRSTVLRGGNFDYVTNSVRWEDGTVAEALPDSLYLAGKPAFFGSLTWPWVNPTGTPKLYTLPARARYDAGVPIPQVQVTSISPVTGSITGGTTVTIRGNGYLAGTPTVTIGGVAATGVVVTGATSLTAVTGPHATGLADVTVGIPAATATLAQSFFYTPLPTATSFYTVAPCRLVDTRTPTYAPALAASQRRVWTVTGRCGVPAAANALALNVTVVAPAANGFIRLAPGNGLTDSSAINFRPGQTRANNAAIMLSTDATGGVSATNGSTGTVHVILDVTGYFQ